MIHVKKKKSSVLFQMMCFQLIINRYEIHKHANKITSINDRHPITNNTKNIVNDINTIILIFLRFQLINHYTLTHTHTIYI